MRFPERLHAAWNSLRGRETKAATPVFPGVGPESNGIPAPWRDDPHRQVRMCRHWVYVAIRAIAARVAGTPLRFFRDDTGEEIRAPHPLPVLFREVNPMETSVDLWTRTMFFLELTGNAYWYAPKNAAGAVAELWVLPSQYVRVVPDRRRFVSGYVFRHGSEEEIFKPDEIVHIQYPSPETPFYGMSPLAAAAESVDAHAAMKAAEKKSFENGAFPGLSLETGERLSPEVRKRLEAAFSEGFSGPARAGRTLILEQGLRARALTLSPREMDFLESGKMTRDEILAVFGVPAAVAGISEDVNRASAEAMLWTFAENTILPKLRLLESRITQDLCPSFDARIIAKFDNPVPSARAEDRDDMVARLSNGVTTPAEERARLGLAPRPASDLPAQTLDSLGEVVR